MKSWSGDHCMNPPDVPGSSSVQPQARRWIRINIMDIGPTVLDLFGVDVPAHCDGRIEDAGRDGQDPMKTVRRYACRRCWR